MAQALCQHPLAPGPWPQAPGPRSLRSGVLEPGAPFHPGLCCTPEGASISPPPHRVFSLTWGRDWEGSGGNPVLLTLGGTRGLDFRLPGWCSAAAALLPTLKRPRRGSRNCGQSALYLSSVARGQQPTDPNSHGLQVRVPQA